MKYMGSKRRIAKDILPIILADRKPDQWYVEPFCGGCNTLEHVTGNRLGADINQDLINLWKAVSNGWMPPEQQITEEAYHNIKKYPEAFSPPLVGYTAFALSYGGKYWGGYSRNASGTRNYSQESYNNAMIQFPKLRGIEFRCSSYEDLVIPERSIIYCDPPYWGTTKYKNRFDSEKFWLWCHAQADKGHTVFVSEYLCPFSHMAGVVYEKQLRSSIRRKDHSTQPTEKLFKLFTKVSR